MRRPGAVLRRELKLWEANEGTYRALSIGTVFIRWCLQNRIPVAGARSVPGSQQGCGGLRLEMQRGERQWTQTEDVLGGSGVSVEI